MTARGAKRLRHKLKSLDGAARAELENLLASATIVEVPEDQSQIAFGAKVTVRDAAGELRTYQIVGVDELDLYEDAVSWISPIGKSLLAAEPGGYVTLPTGDRVKLLTVAPAA